MAPTIAELQGRSDTRRPVTASRARIGPNAIVRVAEALVERIGAEATDALFTRAGLARHLAHPPTAMVDEADVARLQWQLRADLDPDLAREVAWDAGTRTGDYLLAHRIPTPAQFVLRHLPPSLAARVLAKAITKHAWTFAGSGTFHCKPGKPFVLTIEHSPLCSRIRASAPVCHYYSATFERIFQTLVSDRARVTEVACEAAGGAACVFEVAW
jgi:divinyl protochlorophyllide a 8-vinyl-reductase